MRIAHKGTEPGSVLSTPEGEFEADDEGYFDVPPHLGIAQVKFPGWKEYGASHFNGDPKPKDSDGQAPDYAALSRRLDAVEEKLAELSKPAVAKARATVAK